MDNAIAESCVDELYAPKFFEYAFYSYFILVPAFYSFFDYFGIPLYRVLYFFGFIFIPSFGGYLKNQEIKGLAVVYFILLAYVASALFYTNFLYIIDIVCLLSNACISVFLCRYKLRYSHVLLLLINVCALLIVVSGNVKDVFVSSSYHMVQFVIYSALIIYIFNQKRIEHISTLLIAFSMLMLILFIGRTGIFIGLFIFLTSVIININRNYAKLLLRDLMLILFFVASAFVVFWSELSIVFTDSFYDLLDRGMSATKRMPVWECYFRDARWVNIFFGFSHSEDLQCVKEVWWLQFELADVIQPENSFLSLHIKTGIGAIFVFFVTVFAIVTNLFNKDKIFAIPLFIAIVFRMMTGSLVFFHHHDFMFFFLLFYLFSNKCNKNIIHCSEINGYKNYKIENF